MKLITEHNEDLNYLVENKDGKKSHIIEGIFMQADQVNHNKRIYPKMVLEGAVKKYVENYVAKGRAVGELNHPEGPSINLDKEYLVFGKPTFYSGKASLVHPEIDVLDDESIDSRGLHGVYSTTEKLINKGLNSRAISRLIKNLIPHLENNITYSLKANTNKTILICNLVEIGLKTF